MSESTEATGDDAEDFDLESLADLADRIGDRVTAMKRAIVEDEEESDLIELAEDLWELLGELEDVLSTIDFEEVPEAIDFEEVPEAIDLEDVPEGLVDEDETAIDLSDVRQAVHLRELWDAVNLTQLYQEKQELDNAVDDVKDDFEDEDETGNEGEDDGLLEGDLIGGDDEDLIQTDLIGDDEDEDDEDDEFFENVVGTGQGAHVQFNAEARQAFLEEKIQTAVEKFRSALLSTHEKLHKLYEANQRKLGQPGRHPDSLNPTATSTLPPGPVPDSASTRTSTVPAEVKYSKVDNPRRIYGRRFTEATRDEDEETQADEQEETDAGPDEPEATDETADDQTEAKSEVNQ